MEYLNIYNNAKSLTDIIEDWTKNGYASELERDLALDKIKALYEQVRFLGNAPVAAKYTPQPVENILVAETDGIAGFTVNAKPDAIEEEPANEVPQQVIEDQVVSAAEGNNLPAGQPIDMSVFSGDTFGEELLTETEIIIESSSITGEELPEEKKEDAGQKERIKPHIDKVFLRSLYNDDDAAETTKTEPLSAVNEKNIAEPEPETFDEDEMEVSTAPIEEPHPDSKPLMRDRHSMPPPSSGIASKMSMRSLKEFMGINDQFLLMADLFDNNPVDYERTVYELDSITSLDEAMLYVHDRFAHKQNTDGAKLLVDLLVRKLL